MYLDEPTGMGVVGEVEKIDCQCWVGQTMILVSHDMSFVAQVADKVLFLDKGKVCESGTPDEIINHPKEEEQRVLY